MELSERIDLLFDVVNTTAYGWQFSKTVRWVGPHKEGSAVECPIITLSRRDRYGARPVSIGLFDDYEDAEGRNAIEDWVLSTGCVLVYSKGVVDEDEVLCACTVYRGAETIGTGYGPTRSWAIAECVRAVCESQAPTEETTS